MKSGKAITFAATLLLVVGMDVWTKRWALEALAGGGRESLGGLVPLTLAFNNGAAFSLSVGSASRWFFIVLTLAALGVLGVLLRGARAGDRLRIFSVSLVTAGALGNLVDRIRWDLGVVDFIGPINLGFMHWPIFNVADMAITTGAALLAISLWQEDAPQEAAEAASESAPGLAGTD
jgi:signal peptidase II